jgi:1,4-dihydroxy-2-naphthoyl-CoA hydrolase
MKPESGADVVAHFTERGHGTFPAFVGIEVIGFTPGVAELRLALRPEHLAPNGFLHAGVLVTLADTAAGYGCAANLPPGGTSFTTIELKSNFFGSMRSGAISCTATLVHGGRTTQVWDATVTDAANGKTLAAFRCTQLILYPQAAKETNPSP